MNNRRPQFNMNLVPKFKIPMPQGGGGGKFLILGTLIVGAGVLVNGFYTGTPISFSFLIVFSCISLCAHLFCITLSNSIIICRLLSPSMQSRVVTAPSSSIVLEAFQMKLSTKVSSLHFLGSRDPLYSTFVLVTRA